MSEVSRADRPRQVTWGAGFAAGASALLVFSAFDAMTRLHSVATRDELTRLLRSASVKGLGLTVDDATVIMHGALLVAGAGAAVTCVLAVYAMLGHAAARIGLTVLAVVVLVASAAVDALLGLLLVMAVTMLWSTPARDWFAGRPITPPKPRPERPSPTPSAVQPPTRESAPDQVPTPGEPPVSPPTSPVQPPPTHGFGSATPPPPGFPYASPQPLAPHVHQPPSPYGGPPAPRLGSVPGAVKAAAIITWAFSGIAFLGFLATAVTLLVERSRLLDAVMRRPEYQNLDISQGELTAAMWVTLAVFCGWTLSASVLAAFVWRGHGWARVLLTISAAMAALFCLLVLPMSLAHLAASAAVIGLMFSAGARPWFDRNQAPSVHQPGPPGPPSPPNPPASSGGPPVW